MFFIPLLCDILCPMNIEMDTLKAFTKAFALGLAIAAPLGPIGLLCIQRTMISGFRSGLSTGLGAATADALYMLLAASGIYALVNFLSLNASWFRLAGGVMLVIIGALAAAKRSVAAVDLSTPKSKAYAKDFISAFLLTLSNPFTLAAFTGVFAGLTLTRAEAAPYVTGVFSGSLFWWLFLALNLKFLQGKLAGFHLFLINMVSGFTILAFGIIFIIQSLAKILAG